MKIYVIYAFCEELSISSELSFKTYLFSSEEKRNDFIDRWNNEYSIYQKSDEPNKYYSNGWAYWLDTEEVEVDNTSV